MKKFLCYAVGSLMLLASCQKDEHAYTIKGTVEGQDLNGQYAYLLGDKEEALDSAKVEKNAFQFKGSAPELKTVVLSLDQVRSRLFLEPGKIEVKIDYNDPKTAMTVSGTPANEEFQQFSTFMSEEQTAFEEDLMKIKTDESLSEEDKVAQYSEKRNALMEKLSAKGRVIYENNKDNALGLIMFRNMAFELPQEQYIAEYEGAADIIKNDEKLSEMYTKAKNYVNTKSGNNYVDFDATQADGTVTKFSSFIGEKHYLLVDFWASWCGPCKRAMPFIKEVYEKYYRKGLHVLGVSTWDKAEDYEQALKEHGIIWESIFDKDSNGANAYGVRGVPHLMLISPEGVILERGIAPDKLEETVKKYIK